MEIASDCTDIPAGWPRPYYRSVLQAHGDLVSDREESGEATPRYVQWISENAIGQIFACSQDRTYTAGERHACSCCGTIMERGLLVDVPALMEAYGKEFSETDIHDGNYGSPLCYRCALFALKHCPEFRRRDEHVGEGMRWLVTRSPADYIDYDETSILVPVEGLESVTTAEMRADVAAGRMYLTTRMVTDEPLLRRPVDYDLDGPIF